MKRMKASLKYAVSGVKFLFRTQPNFRIHLVCALIAVLLAAVLKFDGVQWGILFVVIGLVISAEAFNTAIEKAVDCTTKEYDIDAKHAKDTAAAAVLLMSIAALCVGCSLYIKKIYELIRTFL